MPREVVLFTDDGQWAAVVTSWEAHYILFHDAGIRVRIYRLGVPDTWGSERGPWSRLGPWLGGPWNAKGPWGAWGPFRVDGPWGSRGPWGRGPWGTDGPYGGPWGATLTRSWVETPAESIHITVRFLGPNGQAVDSHEVTAKASFLRHSRSNIGFALVLADEKNARVRVESIEANVEVRVDDTLLTGQVATRRNGR